jgi:hypothetical protein
MLPRSAGAQDTPAKSIDVQPFDQLTVAPAVSELFGGEYDLGSGLAELVRKRLAELGYRAPSGDADGTVEGTIVVFGREEGRGEVGGVSVGGVRLGIGRRQEKAVVVIEARLIDVASGEVLTMTLGRGESSRSGLDAFARRKNADLGSIDLSGKDFRETSIGEATHKAVDQLAGEIGAAARRLGTIAVAAPVAVAPVAPVAPMPVVTGAVGGIGWAPYQFRGTEHFRFDVTQAQGGERTTGFYTLDLQPAGEGRVRLRVAGKLGDEEYSSSVTTGVGTEGMQMGYGQFMALGPVGILLFNPAAWMMIAGRELTLGDGWSYSSGGESAEIKVEQNCEHAGQAGLLVVFRANGEVLQESCLASAVALPLRVLLRSDDDVTEMRLVEYRP